ncbi:DUF4176 domain-containing protein [Bifidobacterium catulorum]|nr:DUF4176 domain-containing protein [Bifidobacterium catulorum]
MLPIGSVVYLAGGNQKIMSRDVFFDYTGVLYPQGFDPDNIYYFHDVDVDEVVFEGYRDDDQNRLDTMFTNWVNDPDNTTPRGVVE